MTKCMCWASAPYTCHHCVEKVREKLGFCQHDDPSWCDEKCTNKAPEWLDVVVDGKMVEINSKGEIREKEI